MWMAVVDVQKAFDKVHHKTILESLVAQGMEDDIAVVLWRFYLEQNCNVQFWPGVGSRKIPVERGVRQGDLLSPALFILVVKRILQELQEKWRRSGEGVRIGEACTSLYAAPSLKFII